MTHTNSRAALVWLLAAGAILLGAAFWQVNGAESLSLLAAFFTIVGDLLALLALGRNTA